MATVSDGWVRSSFCDSSACIEVKRNPHTGTAVIRVASVTGYSSNAVGATREEWDAFVAGVKAGEFD